MAESGLLTTRATRWSQGNSPSPLWPDPDIFHTAFGEQEKLPLEFIDTVGSSHHTVVEKRCRKDGRLVAVKEKTTFGDQRVNEKLQKEVEILRSVKHYHCVSLLGTFVQRDNFGIVMEPCAICDLHTYLSEPQSSASKDMEPRCGARGSLLPKIMGCLAHGLQYLHKIPRSQYDQDSEGIVRHRDITPSNIVLDGSRVLYTDFGLSKFVKGAQTGSSGESRKTLMYTSPERAKDQHRNRSCDIFSLAAVFAEVFNVYKGRTWQAFREYRCEKDPDKDGYFYKPEVTSAVLKWLDDLATERCDKQIVRLLHKMFNIHHTLRPNAEEVWKTLTTITATTTFSHGSDDIYFCGPCCMPVQHGDPLLKTDLGVDPSKTRYTSSLDLRGAKPVTRDLHFKVQYDKDQLLHLSWKRNLRIWDNSILDVVHGGHHPYYLARKRIKSTDNGEVPAIARNEAKILKNVKHRHIVNLHGTYRHEGVATLLFEPAAELDLRTYLELADPTATRTLNFMRRSLGCLANALACIHGAGYDHGDIRPENILVHSERIYLSKFSFGLVTMKDRKESNQSLYRIRDKIGRLSLSLGRAEDVQTTASTERQQRKESTHYQPPQWQSTCIAEPASDIYALGCVFLEILTVICGKRVRDFAEFRANDKGEVAYDRTHPNALEWLSQLEHEEHKDQGKLKKVIRSMIEPNASERPKAVEVARIMRECKTSGGENFIGDCDEHNQA